MFNKERIKGKIKNNKVIVENFYYMTLLQVFLLLVPFITYPYLVKVLGLELYGIVITAQILASYASIIIDFGSNGVCAKHVSINRDDTEKLSEIVCSVFWMRFFLWIICFAIYTGVVLLVPSYRAHFMLFLIFYGITTNDLLFPQYYFQGIEQMKYSTIVNILIKTVFIVLVFVVVKRADDYLMVPLLYTIGYFTGGLYAMWIVFKKMKIRFYLPKYKQALVYVKDSSAILATDLVCTIKDKFNYLLLGSFSGMSNVVIYDLGFKIYGLIAKPASILSTVFFPRSAKTKNITQFNKVLWCIIAFESVMILLTNIFLPFIVKFFLHEQVDLLPIRLFTLAPLFSTTSAFIISNMCIAFGYNKYALYSILITTGAYLVILSVFYFTHYLSNIYAFVLLAVLSYFVEFLYRLYAYNKVKSFELKKNEDANQ